MYHLHTKSNIILITIMITMIIIKYNGYNDYNEKYTEDLKLLIFRNRSGHSFFERCDNMLHNILSFLD